MKIALWVVGMVLVLIAAAAISFWFIVSSSNKPKGNREEILKSSIASPKKALVVYQPSTSDASSRAAHQIAKGINSEGYEVTLNYPGDRLAKDVSNYTIIVFGSAVYAGQPSKALLDYMSKINGGSNNRIALFSTGSTNTSPEFDVMEKSLNGLKVYQRIKFLVNEKAKNDTAAYNFGQMLAKE